MAVKTFFEDQMEMWKKKEQSALKARYCPKVRMGNWNEELILEEVGEYH